MEKFKIVPAGRVFANQLAPHLRPSDKTELLLAAGQAPLPALLESVEVSDDDMCWAALYQGLPVAMFGANEVQGQEIGGIWLLASTGIYANRLDFQRKSVEYLDKMHERYEYLTNFVDEQNLVSRRWLQDLGFMPVQTIEHYGVAKRPFIQYVSRR